MTGHATLDNIDYNDIKHLIKVRTTHCQGQAKTIPGSNNEAKPFHAFEDEFYRELREQHQRIDLFVRSKSGEIARRLAHLDKQIAQLELRSLSGGCTKIPVRRLEKFSRAEEAILKAGEDIQSLSRFVGAQRLAFQKLLKKYKKWTSSADLGARFRSEVLDRPTSFSKQDFEPLLAQWAEVLAAVRAPFKNGVNWQAGSGRQEIAPNGSAQHKKEGCQRPSRYSSSVADLNSAWESGSNIEIDTALAILPFGRGATKATYWVHPDNIVQVHILLLQYTRLQKFDDSIASPGSPSSSSFTPRGSVSGPNGRSVTRTDDEISCIICDDLQRFARRPSSESISASEDSPGTTAEKAAASIRYSSAGEAIVAVDTIFDNAGEVVNSSSTHLPKKAKFKRKALSQLFQASRSEQCSKADGSKESEHVRDWLDAHQEVQPLVQVQARRTRFIGLGNDGTKGIWATLDKDIRIRRCPPGRLASGECSSSHSEQEKDSSETFPHAVLEVRIEGDGDTELIAALDFSHLVSANLSHCKSSYAFADVRVDGEGAWVLTRNPCRGNPVQASRHATSILGKHGCRYTHVHANDAQLPALKQDIRKIPAATKSTKMRTAQGRSTPEEASTRHTSVSASSTKNRPSSSVFSAQHGESSATSAPEILASPPQNALKEKRRRSRPKKMLQKRLQQASQSKQQRYWNEFDDGSEGSENEAYTIFVDPNASYTIPGADAFAKFYTSLITNVKASRDKVSSSFNHSLTKDTKERKPLVNSTHSPSVDDSDSTDDESSPTQRRYSTFPSLPQTPAMRARETLLFRSCIGFFCASFVLLTIAAILERTGRRKAETTVDAGVIIGVAASLVSAITGVGSMVGRKDDVGWVHRACVFLVFVCVILGSGGLLAALGDSSGKR